MQLGAQQGGRERESYAEIKSFSWSYNLGHRQPTSTSKRKMMLPLTGLTADVIALYSTVRDRLVAKARIGFGGPAQKEKKKGREGCERDIEWVGWV